MRCIFCKKDSSGSRSVEHIMPESIGNKRRTLPVGVVCDACNNYFARKVEEPILSHTWMRNLRAWQQVPNKKGTYPSMLGHIAGTDVCINMRLGSSGDLQFETERKREASALQTALSRGLEPPLIFTIEDDPPPKEMSRFLCKMALENVAELFSRDESSLPIVVDGAYFENIRAYARYGSQLAEWPFSQRRVLPQGTLMKHANTGKWVEAGFGCGLFMNKRRETLFAFCFYGIEFVVNVGGPSIAGFEEWLKDHNGISPMVERLGCHLEAKHQNGKTVH
jgi:HNH endonuclease